MVGGREAGCAVFGLISRMRLYLKDSGYVESDPNGKKFAKKWRRKARVAPVCQARIHHRRRSCGLYASFIDVPAMFGARKRDHIQRHPGSLEFARKRRMIRGPMERARQSNGCGPDMAESSRLRALIPLGRFPT